MDIHDNPNIRVASFFTGIGGFDLAFERLGADIVFQCEIDAFCQRVLQKHWPSVPLAPNIVDLSGIDIPKADVWCAGFPCQDLSLANQGKRKGLEGERSGLFAKFADLAGSTPPKWLVIENVPGLLNSRDGQDFKDVLQTLDDLGYYVAWRILDAKHFGTPQRRRRVYIVASYQNDGAPRVLFGDGALAEMAGPEKRQGHTPSEFSRISFQEADLYAIQHATIGRKPDAGPQAKGYRNDGETYTLDSRGSADVVCAPDDGFGIRDATGVSRELDSRRLRSLGNAVCVHVVHWIASRLMAIEAGNRAPHREVMEYAGIDSRVSRAAD